MPHEVIDEAKVTSATFTIGDADDDCDVLDDDDEADGTWLSSTFDPAAEGDVIVRTDDDGELTAEVHGLRSEHDETTLEMLNHETAVIFLTAESPDHRWLLRMRPGRWRVEDAMFVFEPEEVAVRSDADHRGD